MVSSVPVGDYKVVIQAQNNGQTKTITANLHVYDYTISVSQSDETVLRGGSASYALSLTLVAGSSTQNIPALSLTATGSPADAHASFVPATLAPALLGASAILSVSTAAPPAGSLGDFNISLTAADSLGTVHSTLANLHIYDFTVTVVPASLQILTTGSNAYSTTVTLTPGSSTFGLPAIGLTDVGLPPNSSGGFSPTTGSAAGFSSTFSISTFNAGSSDGITLTITGTDSRSPEGGTRSTMATLVILTPAQAIQLIINQINSFLASNVLSNGQANSLIVKLNHAITSLNFKPPDQATACNQLNAFVNEVNSYVASQILTPAQANLLLGGPLGINAIRAAIPC
jgi:hypothetical protein